jgi:hypothetical protein
MATILRFPAPDQRRRRSAAAGLDRARRDRIGLGGHDRNATAVAMTEFYRLWFAAAERQSHIDQHKPGDTE